MKYFLFLLIVIPFVNTSQVKKYQQLDSLFTLLESENKAMGSFVISKGDSVVYSRSIGYKDIEQGVATKSNQNTKYRIGSITKMFTATMIFQLFDERKLRLEETLDRFFPEIPRASKITISHLLTHSSGLFNITEETEFAKWILQHSTREEMINRMRRHEPVFEPGTKSAYSNSNYILLGYIIEEIENNTYAKVLEERITSKTKLNNTYYGSSINTSNNEAQSYYYNHGQLKLANETNMSNPGGAGAITSTPTDLTRFVRALFSNELLSSGSLKHMITPKEGSEMASGIMTLERKGQKIYGHGGRIDGFNSFLVYIPETETCIAITLNASDYGVQPIAFNMHDASNGIEIEFPEFSTLELSLDKLKRYEGVYESQDLPFILTCKVLDGKLKVGSDPNHLEALRATKIDKFVQEQMGITLFFDTEEQTVLFNDQTSAPVLFSKKN